MFQRKETILEATRATVGKLAASEGCKLVFEATSGSFALEYLKKDKPERIEFRVDDIEELFYHIGKEGDVSPAEQLTFLGFRVKPSKKNGLDRLKNSYLQSREDVNDTVTNRERKYITLEPRSTGDFQTELLEDMKKNDVIAAFLQSGEIRGKNEAEKVRYKAPRLLRMVESEYNEREEAMSSPRKRRTQSRKAEKELNQTILVFPFGGDEEKIVAAAKGLHEAKKVFGGSAPRLHVSNPSSASSSSSSSSSDEHEVEETEKAEEKSNQRGHYLTISTEDRDRLSEREFLNDTLIDFWMQW